MVCKSQGHVGYRILRPIVDMVRRSYNTLMYQQAIDIQLFVIVKLCIGKVSFRWCYVSAESRFIQKFIKFVTS